MEEYAVDANSAIELVLVDDRDRSIASFHPDFTYPIFGEHERIFGYRDLHLQVRMNQKDMRMLLHAEYGDKAPEAEEVEPMDRLREYAPEDVYVDETSFIHDSTDSPPPGASIFSYQTPESTFEVFKSDLKDEKTVALMERVHLLVLFLIEGGSGIDLDEEKWECYFLYQNNPQRLIGFATVYPYYWFHPHISTNRRLRISQFIVLPPYQGRGHGAKLYEALYNHLQSRSEVKEITVEDPSERFDDLRDRCDLTLLEREHVFDRLAAPVSHEWMLATRLAYKLAPLARCVEMALLRRLDKSDARAYKAYRLLVKSRIYTRNKDMLAQVDAAERLEKLTEAYRSVESDYERILRSLKISNGDRPAKRQKI